MTEHKRRSKSTPEEAGGGTTAGLQTTHERPAGVRRENPNESRPEPESDSWGDAELYSKKSESRGAFTAGELGQPDTDAAPGADNPQGAQGGLGALGQQGQGNRQEDELDELEEIEPDIKLGPKDV